MRHITVLALVCAVFTTSVLASDETQKLLDGRRVNDVLQFSVLRDKDATNVTYRADNRGDGVLHDGDTFVTPGTIDLTYKNFNPFKVSITSTETAAPDANQKAVGDFLDALIGFGKTIVPSTEKAGGVARATAASAKGDPKNCMTFFKDCSDAADAKAKLAKALDGSQSAAVAADAAKDAAVEVCRTALRECLRCGGFDQAVRQATTAVTAGAKPAVSADDLGRWVRDANGRPGILAVRGTIAPGDKSAPPGTVLRARDDVKETIGSLNDARDQLAGLTKVSDTCSSNVGTLSALFAAASSLDGVLDANKRLLASLEGILKMLDDYLGRKWRTGDATDSDLMFRQVESDSTQQKTVGLTFRLQKYTIDADTNTISGANDVEATRSMVVRRYRRLVPEVGVAGVYNDLRYPKYSTGKNDAGQTIVKKTTDTGNVDAAITMNLLCNCFGGNFLYPGIQVGVSKAKDYPGILGGLVFRFAQPKQLSFAIGRMLTWYKDLNTLTVNGPVGSDLELQGDLKRRRAPTALYLAAQYNF